MASFSNCMAEYRRQLAYGAIQVAYRGLMDYMMSLRTHFQGAHPDCFVSGGLYCGYMDMTYFAFAPQALKKRNLKVAIVFAHDTFRFEVWLAGQNKKVQSQYWKSFKESAWNKHRVVASTKGVDSIVEHVLVESPDFGDLDALTRQIEEATLSFVGDIEDFLAEH